MTLPPPTSLSDESRKILDVFLRDHARQDTRVGKMEHITGQLDVAYILSLNTRLREYYTRHENPEMLELIDRMTRVMNEISDIIELVRMKKMSLEQAKKEVAQHIQEVEEVVRLIEDL